LKLYTGTGDKGKTSLFSGERVPKSDHRIETYGDVDELNSIIGTVAAALPEEGAEWADELHLIQSHLFRIGSWLATTPESPRTDALPPLEESLWGFLESAIDRLDARLPPLGGFILPSGHPAAAAAHVARTVCRRAERRAVALAHVDARSDTLSGALIYLNRLSDYLFALARGINHATGHGDHLWKE
jgi:cob(I)alamin adenosyltransferase